VKNISLHVDLGDHATTWAGFCEQKPPYSICLDGYLGVGPRFSGVGPYANFDHHTEVDRLSTRATCGQVLMAIRQGLFDTFRNEHGPHAHVWVNDCDEDVCTSWFLLNHASLAGAVMNPILNRLVSMEDALDTTAGAYPYPADLPVLRELAWVFEPYRRFRLSGQLDRRETSAYVGVITDVEHRILRHVTGSGGSVDLDLRYDILHSGKGWMMVQETGTHARTALFAHGCKAFVAVRPRQDGAWTYSIGRMSPFVPFNMTRILVALNDAEGGTVDQWGGSNTIGGSPRLTGSKLDPKVVVRIVEEHL